MRACMSGSLGNWRQQRQRNVDKTNRKETQKATATGKADLLLVVEAAAHARCVDSPGDAALDTLAAEAHKCAALHALAQALSDACHGAQPEADGGLEDAEEDTDEVMALPSGERVGGEASHRRDQPLHACMPRSQCCPQVFK
jgi:hypothetical protein